MTTFTRRIALTAVAAAAFASLPALAAEKVNLGVSIPAATHSFMGGINYWANQAKKDLEKEHKDLKITIKTAANAPEQANQLQDLSTVTKINALVVFPFESAALTKPVAQVKAKGAYVTVVDRGLTDTSAQDAYVAGDNTAFGKIPAEYIVKQLGGKGNVVEMRGIAGVPADTDRHTGFRQALKKYPGIKVVKQTFTGWQFATGGKQILDILNSGVKVDGVWTSGIDYTIVNAFRTAHKKLVPVVGADNNQFLKQLMTVKGFRGAAVTNPATIGGVGAAIAIKLLDGQSVPNWVKLTPQVWDNKTATGMKQIKANYSPSRPPTYSARLQVKPWTTYSTQQLFSCKGP